VCVTDHVCEVGWKGRTRRLRIAPRCSPVSSHALPASFRVLFSVEEDGGPSGASPRPDRPAQQHRASERETSDKRSGTQKEGVHTEPTASVDTNLHERANEAI
jgi:hypothetical protein